MLLSLQKNASTTPLRRQAIREAKAPLMSLRTHHFRSRDDQEATLKRYVWLYNRHLPQKAICHRTPIQTVRDWQAHKPRIFKKESCSEASGT